MFCYVWLTRKYFKCAAIFICCCCVKTIQLKFLLMIFCFLLMTLVSFPFVVTVKEILPHKLLAFMMFLGRIHSGRIFFSFSVSEYENPNVFQIPLLLSMCNDLNAFVCKPSSMHIIMSLIKCYNLSVCMTNYLMSY